MVCVTLLHALFANKQKNIHVFFCCARDIYQVERMKRAAKKLNKKKDKKKIVEVDVFILSLIAIYSRERRILISFNSTNFFPILLLFIFHLFSFSKFLGFILFGRWKNCLTHYERKAVIAEPSRKSI